jgi:LysW-gamma-L-lysine carboxypeptidase
VPGQKLLDRLGGLAQLSALHLDSMDDAAMAPRTGRLPAAFGAAIRATGRQPGWLRRLGTSDLNVVLPAWSCPAVVYGPGDAELDHTPQESIGIEDFGLAISVLTSVLSQL